MPLIVNENSYVTVEEATAYFADRLFSDEWTSQSPEDQAKALIMATRKIDSLPLCGVRATSTQEMEFPRAMYSHRSGGMVQEIEVPQNVKNAVCEEAISILKGAQEAAKRADMQRQGVTSFSLGSLSESYSSSYNGSRLMSAKAHDLLAPYLGGGRPIA